MAPGRPRGRVNQGLMDPAESSGSAPSTSAATPPAPTYQHLSPVTDSPPAFDPSKGHEEALADCFFALSLEHVTLFKGVMTCKDISVIDLLHFKSYVIYFHCFTLSSSPLPVLRWGVTGQCFWHSWWECGRLWECYCKNKWGWTAAPDLSVFLSIYTARVCYWGCMMWYYLCVSLFWIGREKNGESFR